ncbi:MAG: molybdopterin-dependent oxidoreductase, partial [Deltaproteobacteria bacterium]|nr:molybdopterin-dependent oxidoreductase [Deltaproteobacteria bacterium]
MTEILSVVGQRVPRWAAYEKATGSARYLADIKLPGMLVGKILYSPHAHANILKIDTSKAENLPGVEAVITWKDVPRILYNPNKMNLINIHPELELKDTYALTDKARFVGDRIAAVAAVDAVTAQEALELIEVEYEVLPAVFDPIEAMKPGAPRVHDYAENNVPLHLDFPVAWGDVEAGLREADIVLEETFRTAKNHICQFEPCTCIAGFGPDGRLTIWAPSQHAFLHRRKIAELFGLPEGMVKYMTPHLGGGFGKNGSLTVEPACVVLAKKTGRPVKIEFSREEDLFGTETRQRYVTTGKIGLKKDGSIVALQEKLLVDGGAYFTHNSSTTGVNMGSFLGLYRCPNVAAEADCVYSNVHPTGGVRGYGNHEATSVLEQLIDQAADQLGMDPLELRLKNVKKAGDPASTGVPMETCTFEELIKLGAEKIGWKEKKAREKGNGRTRHGIGMGIAMDVSGAHPFNIQHRNAFIKFNEDGSVNLLVNTADIGQNIFGALAQIAAESLGLTYEDIHVVTGDTDSGMFDIGQHASGGCYQIGHAVINAAEEAKKQLFGRAAKMLEKAPEELEVSERRIFIKSDPSKGISVADVAKAAMYNFEGEHLNISGKGSFTPSLNPPPFSVVFTEVEVDTETGEVKVLKILYVADPGRAINPATVEGQLEGAVAQSLGYVLTEDHVINKETGALESDNFNTYKLPSALDMPELEIVLYEEPVPSGPFGAKGIAQGAMIAVTPSIANAIYDAVGAFITDMPA